MKLSKVQDWHRRERGKTKFFCSRSHAALFKRADPMLAPIFAAAAVKARTAAWAAVAKAKAERGDWLRTPEVHARARATLIARGHKPKVRGGNGTKMPIPQATLLLALGAGWEAEHAVKTLMPRGSGYPPCYKIDVANPAAMIAIEVDGNSHQSRITKARDLKKEEILLRFGWKVLRFSNQEVMANTAACVLAVLSTMSR